MFLYRRIAIIAWLLTILLPLFPQSINAGSRHSTLNVVLLGDSNTWLGGDDCSNQKGWNTWFVSELQPASCRSYARSGATWTNTPQTKRNTEEDIAVLGDDNVIYNQICRLTDATYKGGQPLPHLIIIMAGTNDAWFSDKRPQAFCEPLLTNDSTSCTMSGTYCCGTVSPDRVLTLQESVTYGCRLLRKAYPDAMLVLVTPPQTTAVETTLINRTGNIIERVGASLAIPVIRLDLEGCIDREQELKQKRFTYDGTHTNKDGARCIGTLIASKVDELTIRKEDN